METGRNRARAHLQEFELRRYRRRQMEPDELLSANDHLAACDECYDDFDGERFLERTYQFARSGIDPTILDDSAHLSYSQTDAYVDGKLSVDACKKVKNHVDICMECKEEVEEFRQLSDELKPGAEVFPAETRSSRHSLTLWNRPALRLSLEIAAIVTAFVAGGWILSPGLRDKVDDLSRETIELRRDNRELRQKIDQISSQEKVSGDRSTDAAKNAVTGSLHPSSLPPVVVMLKDGARQVTLDATGTVRGYESLPSRYLAMIREALSTGQLAIASPLSAPAAGLRGGVKPVQQSPPFRLVSPVATSVIETQPVLQWEPLEGAAHYSVAIYGSNYQEVALVKDIRGTDCKLPRPLTPGQNYVWQVTAFKDGMEFVSPGPTNTEARFKVLPEAQAVEIERALKKWGDSSLLIGLLCARAGLHDEATQRFRALLEANPTSPIAAQLNQALKSK
jgi:hypothetical protein